MANDDMLLLRDYAENRTEHAFETLVSRHVNLVYSVALRQAGDPHLAQEITQAVFIILAQKAKTLNQKTILPGWLCRTARYAAANSLTMKRRRQLREQEAYMQSLGAESESDAWSQIAPLLDNGLGRLGETDHNALVLRFFEGRSFGEVALALGTTEQAAKKRVARALEKLRVFFKKHGSTLSTGIIASALTANSVQAAPVGLAASLSAAAIHNPVTGSTLILIKTTLKIMTLTKLKSSAVVGGVVLLVAGSASVALHGMDKTDAPKSSSQASTFSFAGYGTPEAALRTWIWAMSTGDFQKVLDCLTPEQQKRAKTKAEAKSPAEIKHDLVAWAKNIANFEISEKETVSPDEVRLHLLVQPYPGHPNVGNDVQVMKKVGNDWKYAGKYGVDISDK